jgi:hypothetical protein
MQVHAQLTAGDELLETGDDRCSELEGSRMESRKWPVGPDLGVTLASSLGADM